MTDEDSQIIERRKAPDQGAHQADPSSALSRRAAFGWADGENFDFSEEPAPPPKAAPKPLAPPTAADLSAEIPVFQSGEFDGIDDEVADRPTMVLTAIRRSDLAPQPPLDPVLQALAPRDDPYRTVPLRAINPADLDAFAAAPEPAPQPETLPWLSDQRFSPHVIVAPPRVLTRRWQEGLPEEVRAIVADPVVPPVQPATATPSATPPPVAAAAPVALARPPAFPAVRPGEGPSLEENSQPAPATPAEPVTPAPVPAPPSLLAPAPPALDALRARLASGRHALPEAKTGQPPALPAVAALTENVYATDEIAIEPLQLDDAEVMDLDLDEPLAPRPPRRPPKHTPAVPQPAARPAPPHAASAHMAPVDPEMASLVQDLLEENKPRPAQPPRKPGRDTWFLEVFDADYLRTLPANWREQTRRDVDFMVQSLGLGKGARLLDLACGTGRHALELAQRGFEVAAVDTSRPLLQIGMAEAQTRQLNVRFLPSDMRELAFQNLFDGCLLWQTSFGYFDDRTNFGVLQAISRALKPGGRFLIDVINRDHILGRMPLRIWWETKGCVLLEEMEFDHIQSVLHARRSFIFDDGTPPRECSSFIRLYTVQELTLLLQQAGLRVMEVSGARHTRGNFLGPDSPQIILLAEKSRA